MRYEQLIEDLRQELRPQRDWGEGRGLFLVFGHFTVGVAAGAWLLGWWFGDRAALAIAFALGAIGGAAHLAFLGRPTRFWRMALRWRTSWVSRGFWGLTLFLCGAALDLAFGSVVGSALAFIGALLLVAYMGFVYETSKAIPFWNSPLHPALYMTHALRGGAAALFVTAGAHVDLLLALWTGITAATALLFALELHGAATGGNPAALRSVRELLAGRIALPFYIGVLVVGLGAPAVIAALAPGEPLARLAMAAIGLASALGDFFLKYSVVRAGVHLPVWTPLSPRA
jgi:formate-dependent nitrite reductase membrane component NrfD